MNSFENLKKNEAGNLLSQRKPRLGKYIALAIILHVVFVAVYLYSTHKESEQRSWVSLPPVKISPFSAHKKELIRHQAESAGASSFITAVRPPMPARLTTLPDPIDEISLPRRWAIPPTNTIYHSTKANFMVMISFREVFPDRKTVREMEVWPEKRTDQQNMHLIPLVKSLSEAPSAGNPARAPVLLPNSDWKKSIGLMKINLPAGSQGAFGTAAQKRAKPVKIHRLAFLAENRPTAPPQHSPVSRPQTRFSHIGKISKALILSKASIKGSRDWKSEKWTANLSPEMVWQKTSETLLPLSVNSPLQPELPRLLEDHMTDAVKQLIRRALQKYAKPVIGIEAKSLTYRDLGLESEGTKFLSGLVKNEIEKQDGVELLDPADISREPQILIEGDMWDNADKIIVHLWALDHGSGRRISAVDLTFRRTMIPHKVDIQLPSGEHLSTMQRMIELIKQNFPRGGDFQLGIWPDKGLDAVYVEGESLIVNIRPEKNAYLHVDYYQVNGKVVHLLPNQHESNYIKAGISYKIGDPESVGYEFKVCEPFGEELIVVVASQNPLGTIVRSLIEPAEPYIKRLGDSLGRQRDKTSMAGSHYIILTKKRDTEK